MSTIVVSNKLSVKGNKKEIAEFIRYIKNEGEVLDFDKLIPMPEDLKSEMSLDIKATIHYFAQCYTGAHRVCALKMIKMNDPVLYDAYFAKYDNMSDQEFIEATKEFEKDFEPDDLAKEHGLLSLDDFGYMRVIHDDTYEPYSWYQWRNDYWGTSNNAINCRIVKSTKHSAVVMFDTFWGRPIPILRKLSTMYPNLHFSLLFSDEDMRIYGKDLYRNNKAKFGAYNTLREIRKFAMSIWQPASKAA